MVDPQKGICWAQQMPFRFHEKRARRVIDHDEGRTAAEAKAVLEDKSQVMVVVPVEILPAIRRLIGCHQAYGVTGWE